jgi:hypothetical protein
LDIVKSLKPYGHRIFLKINFSVHMCVYMHTNVCGFNNMYMYTNAPTYFFM